MILEVKGLIEPFPKEEAMKEFFKDFGYVDSIELS